MANGRPAIDPKSWIDFTMKLKEFTKEVQGDLEMVGREQIRLMCRDAMTFTPPMPKGGGRGLSVAAHKAGMNKLGNDVRRIFIPLDSPRKGLPVLLRQVINAVRGNDRQTFLAISQTINQERIKRMSPVMRKILDDTDWERSFKKAKNYLAKANIYGQIRQVAGTVQDPRPIHDQYKGAVNGRWKKNQGIGGPQYFIDSAQALNVYITQRQMKVGRVKAGWASAMRQVPKPVSKKGVERNYGVYNAPWVDANAVSSQGVFSQSVNPNRVSMTVQNFIGNINNVSTEAGTENIVYGNRVKQMNAAIQSRLEKAIERANRRK